MKSIVKLTMLFLLPLSAQVFIIKDFMSSIKTSRIESIDIVRGLVMVLMALDHVRDYFHINALTTNYPENFDSTNIILFATRFVTHFCAPVFVFLAGTSAYLYGRNKSKFDLSKFLISRGLWLIFVEIFINNFLWWFDVTYSFINLQVIWAIGLSMIALGLFTQLPKKLILIIGCLIVFGHNLLDGITLQGQSITSIIWYMLHQSNGFSLGPNRFVWFAYPVLPWIGVMCLGYSFGQLFRPGIHTSQRKKILLYLGLTATILFFVLRGLNFYADPIPWSTMDTTEKTIISYFNVNKYPPSLAYLLITLGPTLIFLALVENYKSKFAQFLKVFGRVPFFYYIIHIFVIHVVAIIGLLITGKDWTLMILDNSTLMTGALHGYGYPLLIVYLIWIGIVLILYPICKKYMIYKKVNKDKWWLSYL